MQTRSLLYGTWEILEVVLIAAITVFLIRALIVQPFLVSGLSMFSTFRDGDYVLVDEITYRLRSPGRGDVVVFRYPLNRKLFYIKRIIAAPGDRVVVESGQVFVNGKKIKEDYLDKGITSAGRLNAVVQDDELYTFGDNRPHSYDSRNFGAVPFKDIIGMVRVRLLPLTSARVIERPVYE